jgi:hypothetical protein
MKTAAASLLGALAMLAASVAHAGDMHCVWARMPAAQKDVFFATAPQDAGEKFVSIFPEAELEQAALACGYMSAGDAHGETLKLVILSRREHSERWLAAHDGVSAERLADAWAALPPATAERIAALKSNEPWPTDIMPDFLDRLGLALAPSDTSRLAIAFYLQVRAKEATSAR